MFIMVQEKQDQITSFGTNIKLLDLKPFLLSPLSYRPPIRHDPYDAPGPSNLHHLLMPTQQHAHRLSAALSAASGMNLRKAGWLGRYGPAA